MGVAGELVSAPLHGSLLGTRKSAARHSRHTSEHHPWNVLGTSMWVMGPSSGSAGTASDDDGASCIADRVRLRRGVALARKGPRG